VASSKLLGADPPHSVHRRRLLQPSVFRLEHPAEPEAPLPFVAQGRKSPCLLNPQWRVLFMAWWNHGDRSISGWTRPTRCCELVRRFTLLNTSTPRLTFQKAVGRIGSGVAVLCFRDACTRTDVHTHTHMHTPSTYPLGAYAVGDSPKQPTCAHHHTHTHHTFHLLLCTSPSHTQNYSPPLKAPPPAEPA
jgi:hypothetical protein